MQKGSMMRKIRRFEAMGTALIMAAVLAACGGAKNDSKASQDAQEKVAVTAEETTTEEIPAIDTLMKDVKESLTDMTSVRIGETIEFNSSISYDDESMNMDMTMVLDYRMITEPEVNGYVTMNMKMNVDDEKQVYSAESYVEQEGDKLITYLTNDGSSFEVSEESMSEYDLSVLMDDSLYSDIEKGKIEAKLKDETETVGGKEAYVLEMTLSGEDFEKLMQSSFSELNGNIVPEDMEWDTVSAPAVLYIDRETKRPVKLALDCASLGDSLIKAMVGSENMEGMNIEVKGYDLIAEYSDYNTLTPVEIPEAAKNSRSSGEDAGTGSSDNTAGDSDTKTITEGTATMTYEGKTAVVGVPEGFDYLLQSDPSYVGGYADDVDIFCAFSSMSVQEYMESEADVDWMKESEDYTDISVSDVKTKKVGDYDISYVVIEYTFDGDLFCRDYRTAVDAGNNMIFTVDFDSYSLENGDFAEESVIDTVYNVITIQ